MIDSVASQTNKSPWAAHVPAIAGLATPHAAPAVFAAAPSVTLFDLGGNIGYFSLRAERDVLDAEAVAFFAENLDGQSKACATFGAFVIGSEREDFLAGEDFAQHLQLIDAARWDDLDATIRRMQALTQQVRFCKRPVVIAAAGRCFGAGAELLLHGATCRAHGELRAGLTQTAAGLVPAAGGCKEMTMRALERSHSLQGDVRGDAKETLESVRKTFEVIASARVSASAAEAFASGLLRAADRVTASRERLLHDAWLQAFLLAETDYAPPALRHDIPAPGQASMAVLQMGVYTLREGRFISEHDAKVANRLAYVLCGGNVHAGTPVGEPYLLDLEREAFLSLCAEPKTIERMRSIAESGKPLRN